MSPKSFWKWNSDGNKKRHVHNFEYKNDSKGLKLRFVLYNSNIYRKNGTVKWGIKNFPVKLKLVKNLISNINYAGSYLFRFDS